ncbi:MAG: HupE/UreJ family protein [Hyphomicrobium sp.]
MKSRAIETELFNARKGLRVARGPTLLLLILAICATSGVALAHGIHADQIRSIKYGGPLDYFWLGATHMLTGYDHLLFLFGVMFFLTKLKDIVTFITAFTVGHSITLIAATLYGVQANYFLIDAVIAISVIYKGFDNLDGFGKSFGIAAPNLLGMVFGFGLIHGFGLATRLQDIGLPDDGLTPRLLAFNAGIELGQIAALIAMAALLSLVRRSSIFATFTAIANTFLMIAGSLLFLMQMHGYQHTAYPDDFGFSTSYHLLDHFNNDIPSGDQLDQPPAAPPPAPAAPPNAAPEPSAPR